jgi:hypothetical protein
MVKWIYSRAGMAIVRTEAVCIGVIIMERTGTSTAPERLPCQICHTSHTSMLLLGINLRMGSVVE